MNNTDNTGRNLKEAFNTKQNNDKISKEISIIYKDNTMPLEWHKRPPEKNPKHATIPCKWGSKCPFGSKCAFAHGDLIKFESQETKDKAAFVLSKRLQLEKENELLRKQLEEKTENEIKMVAECIKLSIDLQNCKLQLEKYNNFCFIKDITA